jgi:hypothetical protein
MKRQHQNLEFGHNLGEIHSQKKLEKESILAFKGVGVETRVPYIV